MDAMYEPERRETLDDRRTLLLVEDEAIIAMAEASMLRRGGYEVITASTGERALELVEADRGIDLVLMDIDLGEGIDGTRAAELMLERRELPVVFMSSHSEPEMVHRTDRITCYGYVMKNSAAPVIFASLRMASRLYLARMRMIEQEREIEERASEYQWLINSMINAFVIWESVFDDAGRYVDFKFGYFNQAYSEISGLKLEEVQGKRVYGEVWPDTEPAWLEVYGRVAATGQAESFELYHAPTRGAYHCHAYRPWPATDRICVVFERVRD